MDEQIIEWTGKLRDTKATLPDGRVLRVWWSDPRWKASIDGKPIYKRGEDAPSKEMAKKAVLTAAGVAA